MLQAISELLSSKKIPQLDEVQMSALLHYLFKIRTRAVRFEVAEVVFRFDHDHANAQDLFLACTLPSAQIAAQRKAAKLFVYPSDWQIEVMYDGAVEAAIEMFRANRPLTDMPNSFRRYLVRSMSTGMLRAYFRRDENCGVRPVGDLRTVSSRKAVVPNTIEQEVIAKDLLARVTNWPYLRPPLRATLQCIAALGPDFALKEHAYTASGDPDKWKREWHRRPILNPEAIADAMGIPKADVHRYLCQARVILRQVFNSDGKLFLLH